METEEARNYLERTGRFPNPEIIGYSCGINNHSFIFRCRNGKFVLRTNREDMESKNNLGNERKILEFLEEQRIDFAPRPVFFDEEKDIHVIDHVGRNDVTLSELDGEHLREWVEKVVVLLELEFQDFRQFCKKKNYSFNEPRDLQKNIKKFGWERLEVAKTEFDGDITRWLENRISQLEGQNYISDRTGLTHGDIAHSLRKGKKLYFIDWEFAGFSRQPEGTLSYVKVHENLDEETLKQLKKFYRRKTGADKLDEILRQSQRQIRIFDVTWSLMKASQLKGAGKSKWKKYYQQAEERRKAYEKIFG